MTTTGHQDSNRMRDQADRPGFGGTSPPYDVERVRADFPVFHPPDGGPAPVFLDSGASAQKPRAVIDAMTRMLEHGYANVHRGTYALSQEATRRYEGARETVRAFVNAARAEEIVFTAGATDAINLVANTFGRTHLGPGREILISELEHHSNIVPWQMLRDATGATLTVCPITDDGQVDMVAFDACLSDRTALVAMAHTSNVLGTVLPVDRIIAQAHRVGARVLLDACQGIVHCPVDVQALDVDFLVFSGHKLYGPTGIGVLYGRYALLEQMPPWRGGGDMIETVSFAHSTWAAPPARFEAGTPPIVEAVGLAAAMDYVRGLGMAAIQAAEADLLGYATQRLASVPGLRLHGTAPGKAAVVSFSVDWAHPHDVAAILDREGVCLRVGHHCAQPLMTRLGVPATVRASFGLYNRPADVDALVAGLDKAHRLFS